MDRLRCPSSYTGGGSHQLQAHYYHATPHPDETLAVLLNSIKVLRHAFLQKAAFLFSVLLLPSTSLINLSNYLLSHRVEDEVGSGRMRSGSLDGNFDEH